MNEPMHNEIGPADEADLVNRLLGRLGDRATPPSWSTILERHRSGPSRWAWLPSLRDRRLWAVAATAVVALIAVGSAIRVGPALFDGDATDIDTIDNPQEQQVPVTTTTPNRPDSGAAPVDGTGELPTGCVGIESSFVPGRDISVFAGPGRADIDGIIGPHSPPDTPDDDWIWVVGPPVPEADSVTPTHLLADFNSIIVLSPLEPGRVPVLETPWPLGFDLDGDGAEELLAFEQANNFKRVDVYRLDDCSIGRVPIEGDASVVDGFPVDASSGSCQDWCNVGLVCLPDGTLVSTGSEPLDESDGHGDHRWTKISWRLEGGALVEVGREAGVMDFDELDSIDVTNSVNCDVEREAAVQPKLPHAGEALAIADLLGTDVLVATTGARTEPQAQGYVVVDGDVDSYDDTDYRVVGKLGDALVTAGYGTLVPDGPRLDLQGRPISCPPYPWFVEGTVVDPKHIAAVEPIIQDDGGWALLMPGYELGDPIDFGDPLPLGALGQEWWAVPLWEVDCETGQRVQVASTEGTMFPSLTGRDQEVEVFLHIERRGDATFHVLKADNSVTLLDATGSLIVDTDGWSWQISDDGSIFTAMDTDGVVRGFDTESGETRWTNEEVITLLGAETFIVGDRLVFAGGPEPKVAAVRMSSGETLVNPTPFDSLFVRYAG